ncbi:MAG: hypothetical protein E4H01_06590 [Lysobacterales bacterium]|nr:MAG: hypothetical protein E4H01_06590 [Xanthomonadales bacterium]
MKPDWRTILIAICLLAALGAAPVQADRYRGHGSSHDRGYNYGYRGGHGYGHSRGGYGRSYAPLYWGGYGYGPAYYGPGYGSLGLGYGWGGRHDSFGLSLSLPLYFGSSYDGYPAPAPYRSYRYVEPQPAVRAASVPACRQTREYTTEITIGDQVLPAYGTACLQADGSWKIISGPVIADQ